MSVELIVGSPSWNTHAVLPLWFQSLRHNVDPSKTGLVFSVPADDGLTRDLIAEHSEGFAWVEILRDRGEPVSRDRRAEKMHSVRSRARNQILQTAALADPPFFLSWDTDILLPPGAIRALASARAAYVSPLIWMNRQEPRVLKLVEDGDYREVQYQTPVNLSVMRWDPLNRFRAIHYPAEQWNALHGRLFKCDVSVGVALMRASAYRSSRYGAHPDSEEVFFCSGLESRGIDRYCVGKIEGLHLYDREPEEPYVWPDVLGLLKQKPLAADWEGERSELQKLAGLYPMTTAVEVAK